MRVVIVGASGNVGTSLVEALSQDGQVTSVLGLARRRPAWRPAKAEWAEADITTDDLGTHFRAADAVVHLAWRFQPTHNPIMTWNTNVLGSIRVFRAVADAGVRTLVHSSSVGAYSPGPKDRRVDESWPTHGWPTAAYAREKAYLERVLDTFEREHTGCRVVRLRPGFIFKGQAASEQRRLFAGPLLPNPLMRPGLVPILPDPAMAFQALHSLDAAEAFRLALTESVHGPFNIAAEPVVDVPALAGLLGAKSVRVPSWPVRGLLATAWHLRLVPASPDLFDLVMRLPLMDVTRAHTELGWSPRYSSLDAVSEFLDGLRTGAGMDTPPLDSAAGGPLRIREFMSRAGQRP
ncbi:NAD-dependent epimerase/dehydratase family protein [Actinomadura sp. HBU206391]|uniref:NAD-dependent epimerase/dehydratase family protein n=1 Tax=Actinomadura sp. HBU206391 TaxID=2731692 RepID=UPI00164F4355|nr:NAD-dependent epimerase/dehydratase family protein [Actinomadura sp. HBU206391]MBC6459463.1 NAD-dependent epimerase/dehydratase family protein [Actinomadura sp. HBU206391]